jgi:GGDEF domain-containing protein
MTGTPDNTEAAPNRVVDERLFNFVLDLEVRKSQRLQYCVSVICINAEFNDGDVAGVPLADWVIRYIRSTDVVFQLLPSSLALLLIDAETTSLPSIVHRLTDQLQGFVPQGASLTWSAGGACYPLTAAGAHELLEQARGLMVQAKEAGGERLYLPR